MAEQFEREIASAIQDQTLVGAAVVGIGRDGRTLISKAYGNNGCGSSEPLRLDTPMWVASSTKLLAAISAVQLIQQGKLSLTDPVDSILPELAIDKLKILTGFDSDDEVTGQPIYAKPKTQITLQMLLTHTSGLGYDIFDPNLKRLRAFLKLPPSVGSTVIGKSPRLSTLVFEPGTNWQYAIGIDYVGVMIERVSGLTLEDYFSKHIYAPLGMVDTTLDPLARDEAWHSRIHARVIRDAETGRVRNMRPDETMFGEISYYPGAGGAGGMAYSSAQDYSMVLRSLLCDDGVLLGPGGVDMLTKPRLTVGHEAFTKGMKEEWDSDHLGGTAEDWETARWDYALGGGLCLTNIEGVSGEGTMSWGGMLNNHWFLDRANGAAGFYGSWIMPPGDRPTAKMFGKFKKAVVAEALKK